MTSLIPRPPPRSYLAAVSVLSTVLETVLDDAVDVVKVNPLGITIAGTIIFQAYGVQIYNSQKISRYDHVHIFDLVPQPWFYMLWRVILVAWLQEVCQVRCDE